MNEMLYSGQESRAGNFLNKQKHVGLSMYPLVSTRRNTPPLAKIASSASMNAHSAVTELGWDPDMRPNAPTAPLRAPQPKVREKNLGRPRSAPRKENKVRVLRTFSAARRARGPSVHHDACLDPGRPPWRCSEHSTSLSWLFLSRAWVPPCLSRAVAWKTPHCLVLIEHV